MSARSEPIAIENELLDKTLTQPSGNEFGSNTAEEIGRLETGATDAAALDTLHGASDVAAPTGPAKGGALKAPANLARVNRLTLQHLPIR